MPKLRIPSMAGHTPGPWSRNIKPASKYSVIFAGRNTHVASVCTQGLSEAEIEGSCALIAAAPSMYAALLRIATLPHTLEVHGAIENALGIVINFAPRI